MISYCNTTGLKVEEKPEWQFYSIDENYSQLIRIVDDNIIVINLSGFASTEGYTRGMEIIDIFLSNNFRNKKFYFLFDYTNLLGSTLKVRIDFTNWVLARIDQMRIVAFFGLNLSLKMYINTGRLLSKKFSKVHVTKNYETTIDFILNDKKIQKTKFNELISNQIFSTSIDYTINIKEANKVWEIILNGTASNSLISDLLNFIKSYKENISTDIYIICNIDGLLFDNYEPLSKVKDNKIYGELALIQSKNLNEFFLEDLSYFLNTSIFTSKEMAFVFLNNLINIKSDIKTSLFDKLWLRQKAYFKYNSINYKLIELNEWREELREGSIKFNTKIIDTDIYIRSISGYLKKGDLSILIKSINKIFLFSKPEYQKYYWLMDFKELSGASLNSRKEAISWFLDIVDETKAIVFYNLNFTLKTIVNYGKSTSKKFNNVYIADNFDEAFELVNRIKQNKPAVIQKVKKRKYLFNGKKITALENENKALKESISNEIKDVTEIIGQISWEEFYEPIKFEIKKDNKFSDLYNAINLLQSDIKDIISRKKELTIKASESEALKSAFLANISHEIRTPLNGILGFSELLTESEFISQKDIKYLKIINQNGNHLLKLINNIIDISKIEIGNLSITENNIELNSLLSDITESIFSENENVSINAICSKDVEFKILTDELRLVQVLTNLINNAIKFTAEGSVSVSYSVTDNENIEFKVSDTGIGMNEQQTSIIFERFRQANDKTSYKYGGTGLGLYISKRIVELMKGEIWVESKEGVGSNFYFTIPLKKPNIIQINESEANSESNLHKYKILIVDDIEDNIFYLNEALLSTGIEIIIANTGKEAIDMAANEIPDLILMDILLPDINGFEASKIILDKNPNIKIIAQTAFVSLEDKQKAMEIGCVDYLTKPIKKSILLSSINQSL